MDNEKNIDRADTLLEEAMSLYNKFRETMRALSPVYKQINPREWNRFDAYPGWDVNRDQGSGMGLEQWLEELQEGLYGGDEEEDEDA